VSEIKHAEASPAEPRRVASQFALQWKYLSALIVFAARMSL
jgi:hypothetical protein